MSIEKQTVWRTLSKDSTGFYVWDVMQVVGDPGSNLRHFHECLDGSYIYIQCFHFWTEESATDALNIDGEEWLQTTIVAPENKVPLSVNCCDPVAINNGNHYSNCKYYKEN